jgi:aspartyl-tRNA(Asn)/glutamyl-tRNA(Gln) amidotransferase subunit A
VVALRRAGCVFLGKVKTVEFALGITGVSAPRGTPWNPWDAGTRRLPGGSSSGSGVATAGGLCAFAIGSDTGGSVRVPAAMNGIVGLKTSFGLLSNDGAFPLASHLDSIGPLTRSVDDASIVLSVLTGETPEPGTAHGFAGLRLGRPNNYFLDELEPEIASRFEDALDSLRAHGCAIVDLELPEAPARERYFPVVLPVSLVAALGRERAEAGLSRMDPVIAARVRSAFDPDAITLASLERERTILRVSALTRLAGLDALVTPTTANLPPAVDDLAEPKAALAAALGMTRNTQPANYLDLCSISLPLPMAGFRLPAGFQLMAPPRAEAKLLAIAALIEDVLGKPDRINMIPFVT